MKIRSDFVTNSSSSSFICMTFSSKEIEDYVTKNGFRIQDLYYAYDDESGEFYSLNYDEKRTPSEWLINYLNGIIEDIEFMDECGWGDDDDDEVSSSQKKSLISKAIEFIYAHKEEVDKGLDIKVHSGFSIEAGEGFGYSIYHSKSGHGYFAEYEMDNSDLTEEKCKYRKELCTYATKGASDIDKADDIIKMIISKYGKYIEF